MIHISHLQKYFGKQTLFSDVNLNIGPKEKIGLIGRNGSGKSTFLKILLSQDSAQEGLVEIPSHFKVRALEQHLDFSGKTILEQVTSALPKEQLSDSWKAKSILMGLGFTEDDFDRAPDDFSSGFKVRIRLAEALVADSDLLLLDEPTNYLDIISLRWLSRFLKNWKSAFILVTHDRHFMEDVVTHTVAIHRGRMRKMKGGPKKLMNHIQKDEEIYEKTRQNQIKKQERSKEFIRNFRSGARSAGLVQSRIKALEKQKVGEKLEHLPKIRFQFRSESFKADTLLQVKDMTFGYKADDPLIHNFSMEVLSGDRIAIVGKNGQGKSTLLKLLTQKLRPQEGGVTYHPNLKMGYFGADNKEQLSKDHTILQEMRVSHDVSEQQIRNVCGSLLFTGKDVNKKISVLSGGEKSRVCLGKVILSPSHLLLLDEPTNHLDMESCQALTESLKTFDGTVIFVTHDEAMLSAVANRLIVFDSGTVKLFEKGYDDFLEENGWSEEEKGSFKLVRHSSNKKEYLEQKEAKKQQRMVKKQMEKLEKEITSLEKKKAALTDQFNEACLNKEVEQIRSLGIEMKELDDEIEEKYQELEEFI